MSLGRRGAVLARARLLDDAPETVVVERGGDLEWTDEENRRALETQGVRLVAVAVDQRGNLAVVSLEIGFEPGHVDPGFADRLGHAVTTVAAGNGHQRRVSLQVFALVFGGE